ncbi:CD209 antigen-like protein A [Anableps anableps]
MTKELLKLRGWTLFRVSCYLLSTKSGSWDEGRGIAKDRGADKFLSTLTKKEAWIGLNDKETEGFWKWVDGSPLT